MKKIYTLVAGVLLAGSAFAQPTNLGFETWAGTPEDASGWYAPGFESLEVGSGQLKTLLMGQGGTITGDLIVKGTTSPAEASAFAILTTRTVSGLTGNFASLNGPNAGGASQKVPFTTRTAGITFKYQSQLSPSDSAVAYVELTKNAQPVGVGRIFIKGNNAAWTTGDVNINYTSADIPDSINIIFSSSIGGIYGGVATPVDGSSLSVDEVVIKPAPVEAPAVTNIVATDISNNGNGLDLKVDFTIPASEAEISAYRIFVIESGYFANWATIPAAGYTQIAKTGANISYTFNATSDYLKAQGSSLVLSPIVNDVQFDIYVMSVGVGSASSITAGPATIKLTTTVATAEIDAKNEIRVYPNPANEMINFDLGEVANAKSILIYNISGQLMNEVSVTSSNLTVDLNAFSNGMYIYRVIGTNNENLKTDRFQIAK